MRTAAVPQKMKSRAFFVVVLGILCVIVNCENVNQNNAQSLLNATESRPKQIQEILNKDVFKEDNYQENVESDVNNEFTERYDDTEVDIIVEETIDNPPNNIISQEETESVLYENLQDPQIFNPYIDKVILNNEPNEIMETAAGFVPIPIIRYRHKPRRPFVTRRNFRRNPYPYRFYFLNPYSFYYPSSLRYY